MALQLALAPLLALVAAPAAADTLIDNVNGMSLDRDGKVERFNGLLVGDDGRIEQVFQRSDKRPGKVDFKVDGKGRPVIPGFVDSHVRLMPFGLSLLTGAAPDAKPRPEDRDQALLKAQRALLAQGITAVADMGTTIEDWQTYRRAGDTGALALRILAYAEGVEAMILIGGPGPTPWLYDDRLRLNGVKLTLDGPLLSRAAALKAPYADASQSPAKVALRLNDTQLKNLMSRAAMDGFQSAVEANGDRAVGAVLDALAELTDTYKGDRRWRIETAELVDPADLPRLAGKGVSLSMQPQQAMTGSTLAEARLGPARLAGAYAWKSLVGAGATLGFGSGAPGAAPEPFADLATAVTRQRADGEPYGGWQAQERLTREAALAAWTAGSAWAGFAEGRFGRLAKGQRADFLLLDRDPLLATPAELRATRVLQTWVGGKLLYQAKDGEAPAESR